MDRDRQRSRRHGWIDAAACTLLLACGADHGPSESDEGGLGGDPQGSASVADAAATMSADAAGADAAATSQSDASHCEASAGGSGCGAGTDARVGEAGPSQASDAAPPDAATTSPDAGELGCEPFPSFDRGCGTQTDCAIGTRPVNCCGTLIATGIRKSDDERFRTTVAKCQAGQICDCVSGPTRADDGTIDDFTNSAFLRVACVAGQCRTSYHEL